MTDGEEAFSRSHKHHVERDSEAQRHGGESDPAGPPFSAATGTANGVTALEEQGPVTSRDVEQVVASFLAVLDAGVIDQSDEELMDQLWDIHEKLGGMVNV